MFSWGKSLLGLSPFPGGPHPGCQIVHRFQPLPTALAPKQLVGLDIARAFLGYINLGTFRGVIFGFWHNSLTFTLAFWLVFAHYSASSLACQAVIKGLKSAYYSPHTRPTATRAHSSLPAIVARGDILVLQETHDYLKHQPFVAENQSKHQYNQRRHCCHPQRP